jgi:hypothetical protein
MAMKYQKGTVYLCGEKVKMSYGKYLIYGREQRSGWKGGSTASQCSGLSEGEYAQVESRAIAAGDHSEGGRSNGLAPDASSG